MDFREKSDDSWPLRPWIMAGICAVTALAFDALTDSPRSGIPRPGQLAGATFLAVAALSFALTVEKRRSWWSILFALGWGAIVALVGWFTAGYNSRPSIFEWPFFSGLLAVMLAAPLFQTARDEGCWRFPYPKLHCHVWLDAVIGGSSLLFTGLSFLLAWLIAGLFHLIGIRILSDLLRESAFGWALAGFAFGASVGLLRERDGLAAILYRLVTVALSVLAPILAGALILFLASLPLTGLQNLWDSTTPTPTLLLAAAAAFALTNAVIGDGTAERRDRSLLHWSALALSLTILPLAAVAGISLAQRIGQYGWTPERIWGVLAVGVALAYGVAGWWSLVRQRIRFDVELRRLQTGLAMAVCAIALLLALPILDFGAISARSQMERLESGRIGPDKFDWQAMAFQFGPSGRQHLERMAQSGPPDQKRMASAALSADYRYDVAPAVEAAASHPIVEWQMRVFPQGTAVPDGVRAVVARTRLCRSEPCVLSFVDDQRAVLLGRTSKDSPIQSVRMSKRPGGDWIEYDNWVSPPAHPPEIADVANGKVEIRSVQRRQMFIDGFPVGEAFE